MAITARLCAVLALFALASPAHAGFVAYSFTTDSSFAGGSLSGSFRVDEADIVDGKLTAGEIQNYEFTFIDPSGEPAHYALNDLVPDLLVDPETGIPIAPLSGLDCFLLGDQIGDGGLAQVELSANALVPNGSFWVAINLPTGENDAGFGHWTVTPAGTNPVPAPPGAALGIAGASCLVLVRRMRSRSK